MPYGNPVLPPCNSQTSDMLKGKHGSLQVRPLPEADTFGLFYLPNPSDGTARVWTMLATHPNGHSCKELAVRILSTWEGKGDGARAVAQYEFILDCGGTGRKLPTILRVIEGMY